MRLSANFRSQAGIVGWINAAFAPMMPAHDDAAAGAVPYAPSAAVHPSLPGSAVEVHPFFDGDDEGEAARVVELVAASGGMRRTRRSRCWCATATISNGSCRASARRVCASARSRSNSSACGRWCRTSSALTRAAAHPADRPAWLAVLRAPWCGLELADLCTLAEGTEGRTVWELMTDATRVANLSAGGRARLEQVRAVLGNFGAGRFRGSLRDRVEDAWLTLGGPACVDDTALEDAAAYLDVLEEAEVAGAIDDRARFEARVAALWALPDVHTGATDVQIMTIHKAKGLEFDHVIVPGLGRPPRGEDARLFLWTERESGGGGELLVAPIAEAGVDGDPVYERLAQIDAEREDHEAARLLYVAATRARERLHLLGDVKRDEPRRAPREPGARTLLAKLWPAVARRFEDVATAGSVAAAPPAPAPLQQDVARLVAGWRPPAPPPGPAWSAPPAPAHALDAIQYSWVGETARHVGSVVHRWLQHLADDRLEGWDEARVEQLRRSVRSELAVHGVRAGELDEATRRALSALRAAIADPRGRWVLGRHPYAATEHRLTAVVDGAVQRLVIDRLFEAGPGERWIVDYKTSTHEGADPEGFLDQERARYAAQLERYARALGGTSRLGLYFPLLTGWREI